MAGIGIIANPHSKQNKRDPERKNLLAYIIGSRGQLEVTNDLAQLKRVAEDFRDREIEILAINGGDGTVSKTLTAFVNAYGKIPLPKIAILRGGTMNMLADNLRIKGSPQELLIKLMETHSKDIPIATAPYRSLKVGEEYGFLFATGTSAYFLREFYKKKTGHLGVLFLLLKIYFSIIFGTGFYKKVVKNEKIKIKSNTCVSLSCESLSLLASTVKKLPMGIPFFLSLSENRFDQDCFQWSNIVLDKKHLFLGLLRILLFRIKKTSDEVVELSSWLELKGDQDILYTIDGELFKKEKIFIEMGPVFEFISL
jgi:diacylglycerol kinase (ATP)